MLETLSSKISSAIKTLSGKGKITEGNVQEAVEQIKTALIDADVNLRVVRRFVNSTLEEARGQKVVGSLTPGQVFTKIVYDKIVSLLKGESSSELKLKDKGTTSVILLCGLQGNGKTTTAAKLAKKLKDEGRRPLLAACDLQRPAAVDQLRILSEDAGVDFFFLDGETRPNKVAGAAFKAAKGNQNDVLILDTAGRLNIDSDLMAQLKKINSEVVCQEKLLVIDSMIGQAAAQVADDFNKAVGITGVVLTKFDSDSRGGAAMSVTEISHVPIKAVGVGEKLTDLDYFYPERVAQRILGMGDVISLVEKAQKVFTEQEAQRIEEKTKKGEFDLNDYLMQIEGMTKMGGAQKLIGMLPGLSGINTDDMDFSIFKREKAFIQSMTPTERSNYKIIGPPRKKRIAKGAGMSVNELEKFLKKFEKMRDMMKKVSRSSAMQGALMNRLGLF